MGGLHSITLEPEPLTVFRGPRSRGTINIPELASNRVCTNKFSPIFFFFGVVILLPCLIYICHYSDLERMYGYDGCGNVCGKVNKKYDKWECTGKNFTNERFLEIKSMVVERYTFYNYLPRECVSDCSSGFKEVNNLYCLTRETNEYRIFGLLLNTSGFSVLLKLVVVACVALVLSFMVLMWFAITPYVVATINAVIIASVMIGCTSALGYYGIRDENYIKVGAAVAIGIIGICFIGCLLFFFKKIRLVLALFVEAGQVFLAMPQLLIAVLLETLATTALLIAFLVSISYIFTTGILTESEYVNNELEYKYDALMYFGIVFNCIMFLWASMICSGMRYMVIGGAVTTWYFARDKSNLHFPLSRSAFIAFRFHLGTVVLGSLTIMIISVIRGIVNYYTQNRVAKVVVDGVLGIIETTLTYLSKNAYIITAMHGTPFYKSGKRAMKILLKNILDVLAVKGVGEFILLMNMIMVILLTLLAAYMFMGGDLYNWSYYVNAFLIAVFMSGLSYDLLETIVDTLFMCFCEDILLNAGSSETMPDTLKEFLRTAIPVFKRKEGSESDLNRIRLQNFS